MANGIEFSNYQDNTREHEALEVYQSAYDRDHSDESQPAATGYRQRDRIWGLKRRTFFIVLVLFFVVIVAAIVGGAVGGTVSHQNNDQKESATTSPAKESHSASALKTTTTPSKTLSKTLSKTSFSKTRTTFITYTSGASSPGGFANTCNNLQLIEDHILQATCAVGDGHTLTTQIDLNSCVVNFNNVLDPAVNGGFAHTCSNCNLMTSDAASPQLNCNCNGKDAELALEQFIQNANGFLYCYGSFATMTTVSVTVTVAGPTFPGGQGGVVPGGSMQTGS